jgi:hypothetical protein
MLAGLAMVLLSHGIALAEKPKLDEVLKSISANSRGSSEPVNWMPFLLVIVSGILVYVAVKHWNRRQTAPKALNNHAKLMKEAAPAAGVSVRSLKNIESLARGQGLSSPLVAMLCPSAITELARHVKTDAERRAINDIARQALKP